MIIYLLLLRKFEERCLPSLLRNGSYQGKYAKGLLHL